MKGDVAPGERIRLELEKKGWSQEDLAAMMGRTTTRVSQIITGKQELSPEIAIGLASVFDVPAEEWLRLEASFRLSRVECDSDPIRQRAKLYQLAPIKEMQKRGWLPPADAGRDVQADVLRFFDIPNIDVEPSIHGALRKTAPNTPISQAQRAWAFQVRRVAAAIPAASVGRYSDSRMDACRAGLRKLASYSAGIGKASALLASFGIRFVVVEGLTGAKIDGFATWLDDESPVIGMSLRYDKLDSFWFTLGHELSHIAHRDIAPVDGDVSGSEDLLEVKPLMERRADAESAAMFIPPDELKSFAQRIGPLFPIDKINQLANRIKIHPTIIIGQLKHTGAMRYSAHPKTGVPVREAVTKSAVTDGWGKHITLGDIP